ncbi:YcxB family protein [Chloroflexota bacterium]
MDIESELTRRQYMKLNLLIGTRRSSFYFFIAIFFALLIVGLLARDKGIIAFVYLAFMIIVCAISTLYMGLSKKNRNFFLKRQYTFNDENVLIKAPIAEEVVKWDAFINWEKMGGYYLLYLSSATFLVIPKSDIPANDITAFENLLASKIGITKSRTWTWKIKGLLTFLIILSVTWLFTTFAAYYWGDGILSGISRILVALIMVVPVAILVTEFCFIIYGKRSSSRRTINVSSSLLFLTIIGMLIVILDIFFFVNFMY